MFHLGHTLLKKKHRRGGVIPYVYEKGKLNFLLGVDSQTRELTDFGGGIKHDENTLVGSIREFREESKGIFDYNLNDYSRSLSVSDNEMSILFYPVDKKWLTDAIIKFEDTFITEGENECDEIYTIQWYPETEFFNMIESPPRIENRLWSKIKNFFVRSLHNNEQKVEFKQMLQELY